MSESPWTTPPLPSTVATMIVSPDGTVSLREAKKVGERELAMEELSLHEKLRIATEAIDRAPIFASCKDPAVAKDGATKLKKTLRDMRDKVTLLAILMGPETWDAVWPAWTASVEADVEDVFKTGDDRPF